VFFGGRRQNILRLSGYILKAASQPMDKGGSDACAVQIRSVLSFHTLLERALRERAHIVETLTSVLYRQLYHVDTYIASLSPSPKWRRALRTRFPEPTSTVQSLTSLWAGTVLSALPERSSAARCL
jgi:hypothetical protein